MTQMEFKTFDAEKQASFLRDQYKKNKGQSYLQGLMDVFSAIFPDYDKDNPAHVSAFGKIQDLNTKETSRRTGIEFSTFKSVGRK